MNISLQNIDKVNALINIEVAKADYQENVDKTLRDYRKKANIPGFRKGMAPMGMINKMFGKQAKMEEINKTIGEALFGYIRENKINVLGEPLPSAQQEAIDFDSAEDFVVSFDIAIAPEFNVELSKEDKVDYYNISITEEMIEQQVSALQQRFGSYQPVEEATDKDMIKGDLAELDEEGNIKEGGLMVEGASLMPAYFHNDEQKAKFADIKKFASIDFNPSEAAGGNEAELASILKMSKEDAQNYKGNFRLTVTEITHFVPAEKNEEFFKNACGDDCTTEELFIANIKEMIAEQLVPEQDYKFGIDARKMIETKIGEIEMPEAFLKRWLLATGKDKTAEQVEEEFPKMLPELKWHLIKEQLVKNFNVKVEDADMLEIAKRSTMAQFAQYGMANVPAELLENYAKQMLQNKEAARNIAERAIEDKIVSAIKEAVSLDEKGVTIEEFQKLFETK